MPPVAQLQQVAQAEDEGGGGQRQGQGVADGHPLQQRAADLQQAQHRLTANGRPAASREPSPHR